jgi:curli biogenesis system outer membrane secretion channel CsgG
MQEVANSADPFLKVVDRENQQMILQEQQLALSGMLDENTAIEVGGLLGAKALMKGTVVSYEASQTELRRYTRQGFESYRVEKVNAEGKKYYDTQYRAVTYMEFEQSREVSVTFNLALISLATGETLASEMITRSKSDAIRFAKYTGNRNNLFPANMSGTVNRSGQRELQGLLASRQELIAESSLLNDAVQESAKGIREALERNLLEIVP